MAHSNKIQVIESLRKGKAQQSESRPGCKANRNLRTCKSQTRNVPWTSWTYGQLSVEHLRLAFVPAIGWPSVIAPPTLPNLLWQIFQVLGLGSCLFLKPQVHFSCLLSRQHSSHAFKSLPFPGRAPHKVPAILRGGTPRKVGPLANACVCTCWLTVSQQWESEA